MSEEEAAHPTQGYLFPKQGSHKRCPYYAYDWRVSRNITTMGIFNQSLLSILAYYMARNDS